MIKVTGNPEAWARMSNNMDVNAGTILDGNSLDAGGGRVYDALLDVTDGRRTAAERRRLEEFAITRVGPSM